MSESQIVINGIVFLPHTWPLLAVFVLVVGGSIAGLVTCAIWSVLKPKPQVYAATRLKLK
jgi:hypothetical protein